MAKSTKRAKAKTIVKSDAVKKVIDSSLDNLSAASISANKAVDVVSKESKKLKTEAVRLRKKRDTLQKRKKAAMVKLKKTPNAANKKALSAAVKELTGIEKLVTANIKARETNTSELKELKTNLKRAAAFVKSLQKIDKELNKQPKKKKKTKAKKASKSKTAKAATEAPQQIIEPTASVVAA